jgi:hypothetical protein
MSKAVVEIGIGVSLIAADILLPGAGVAPGMIVK